MRGRPTPRVIVCALAAVLAVALGAVAGCGDAGSPGGDAAGDPRPGVDDATTTHDTTTTTDDPATTEDDAATTADDDSAGREGVSTTADTPAARTTETAPPVTRPDWLGTRPIDPGQPPPPTPAELDPRRLPTVDRLPPPADGAFHATVAPVPADVVARSTWQPACPVSLDELRYVTVSFWGFDDRAHTGELLLHRDAAEPLTQVFRELFALRFPIEEMHVTSQAELDAPDTGDGNATAAFVCRPTRGGARWSEHAYGLAVDINPFQNPYGRDGGVIPGLASSYLDRENVRPGMLLPGEGVIEAFAAIGWEWGGAWRDPVDYMHFSAAGR